MMLWYIGIAYIGILCALTLLVNRRGEPMRRTALVLFADMVFGYFYSFAFGGGWDYSVYMILINTLACMLVTWNPAGRWQALIGWSFILQIGTDIGRVASDFYFGMTDMYFVYWATTALAYFQLLLLAGWVIDERAGYLSRFARNVSPDKTRPSGLA